MVLRTGSIPVVQPARRVPLTLQEPLREELDRMERAAIITKVTEPTDWFVPGKQLLLADMLSRSTPINHPADTSGSTEEIEVHAVGAVSDLVSRKTLDRLVAATASDPELQKVIRYISGSDNLDGCMKPFATELSLIERVVLKGTKVLVPKSMRNEILQHIETMLKSCAVCRKYAYRQPSEPFMLRPTPGHAWYRVGVDIFQHGGSSYLCVFDAQSNFPEVEKLGDTTSSTIIAKLSCIFARYGIPVEVCSDNGPQFASHEFATFASRYDFKHGTSSPGFPQSNGLAEKGVQIVKRIMKKTQENHDDFWLGLLSYRSTPLEHGRSPGELLQGRRLRTRLPDFSSQPKNFVSKHRQLGAHRKDLPVLRKGDVVRIRDKAWTHKAQVVGPAAPRSYRIVTEGDQVLRRNRRHLITTREPFRHDDLDSDEPESEDYQPVTSPCPQTRQLTTPIPRRSRRITRQPRRLQYDHNFNQVHCVSRLYPTIKQRKMYRADYACVARIGLN
nr:uncharacterized protein LOC126535703 [Dermacentor andersoni]